MIASCHAPKKGVILDRDGTLVDEHLHILPGVSDALRLLQQHGYQLAVATNQPDAAKGKKTVQQIAGENEEIEYRFSMYGVTFAAWETCMHHPIGSPEGEQYLIQPCLCRKPGTKLLETILNRTGWVKSDSWMVGDQVSDIEAGLRLDLNVGFLNGPQSNMRAEKIVRHDSGQGLVETDIIEMVNKIVGTTCR